ncbi:MAG: hypothetical protein JWO67_6603 [Streptosporangiaceae bacterium]|nr:hypothetical protein [Streptosporangiaceae bacterium]
MKSSTSGLCLLLSLLFAWCALGPHNVHYVLRPAVAVTNR